MQTAPFIVLDGIDGSGTTTHSARLVESLRGCGLAVHGTREPSEGPIGAMLRQILTGRAVTQAPGGVPGWNTLALLFSADRLEHLEAEIAPNLASGVTVICDRYDYSTVAYQSLGARGLPIEASIVWLRELNRFARRPDLTIVLDVPAEVARERRMKRAQAAELFDDDALQRSLAGFYAGIERYFPGDRVVHISADRDLESVANDILAAALAAHGRG